MSLRITELSESLKLEIYEKLSISALCRLRATRKEINEFIEEHRYDLSSRRHDGMRTLRVILSANGLETRASDNGYFKAHLPQPFEQTSALALQFDITIAEAVSQEGLDELVSLAQKIRCATLLVFDDSTRNYPETCLTIASLCSYRILNTITDGISLSRYLSIPSVQNAKELAIGMIGRDDVPVEGLLRQIENMDSVHFEVEGKNSDHIVQSVIPQILKDAVSYEKQVPLPRIGFLLNELIDVTKKFPNLRLIYRKAEPSFSSIRACYGLAIRQKIFLIMVAESVILPPWQALGIHFVSKGKNALKKALSDNLGHISDRLMDHMYNNLVRNE